MRIHLLRHTLLLMLLPVAGLVSAAETTTDGERLLPDKEQERMMALSVSQPADTESLWLETQHESYLALFQPANRPKARGGIVLLPHDRTSPDWPGAIQTLRRGLPDMGWHTLSIALPDEPLPILPRFVDAASGGASSAPPSTDEAPLQSHFDKISQRIDAALAALRQRGANKVYLVGEGSGAYWACRYLSEQPGQRMYPILIDATQPNAEVAALHQLSAQFDVPVLDLYHGGGLGRTPLERQAKLRQNAAKREGRPFYLSVRMPPKVGDWRQTDPRLLSLVNGLIERHLEPATQPKPVVEEPPRGQQAPGRKR